MDEAPTTVRAGRRILRVVALVAILIVMVLAIVAALVVSSNTGSLRMPVGVALLVVAAAATALQRMNSAG